MPEAAKEVESVLTDDLLARQPLLVGINSGLGAVVAAVFWPVAGVPITGIWLAALIASQVVRALGWLQLRRRPRDWRARGAFLTVMSALTGVSWGATAFTLFCVEPIEYPLFLFFVLAGLCAGSVAALPAHLPSFYAFGAPLVLPYIVRLLLEENIIVRPMAAAILLFALALTVIGLQVGRMLRRSAWLGIENCELVVTLQRARNELLEQVTERTTELSSANMRLLAEIEQRRNSESRVRHLLQHDPLTGLPNRLLFQDRLGQALRLAKRDGRDVALLMLDIDRFKEINDTRGHPVGDRLLQAVAVRLSASLRGSDTLARLGGDEFAVIQLGPGGDTGASRLAGKLLEAFSTPFRLDGEEIHSGTSIGIAIYPRDGEDSDVLVSHADIALYVAKETRNTVRGFVPEMAEVRRSLRRLDEDMRRGLRAREFILHYQPRYELNSGRMTGVEALVRWIDPERGLLMPPTFIDRAESTGLIRPLGRWVLTEACRQAAAWRDSGRDLRVSVNLSPAQFREASVSQMVAEILDEVGLAPERLELEITETLYLEYASAGIYATLRDLRSAGVALSIDDFGTGYSSLAYLKHLPFDVIKIDRAFVRELATDQEDKAIVHAVVTLVHNLGKRVVAEGVETGEQLSMLRELGCDEAQGFLLARPSEAARI